MPRGVFVRTAEYRKNMSILLTGKVYSEERRRKISIAKTGRLVKNYQRNIVKQYLSV